MVVVNRAKAEHVDGVVRIAEACGLSFWSREQYLGAFSHDQLVFLVAIDEDDVIGFVLGRVIPDGEASIYNIGTIRPRSGIGKRLMEEFQSECRQERCASIWLEVRVSNLAARKFYESLGFTGVSIRNNFYRDPDEDALVMSLDCLKSRNSVA